MADLKKLIKKAKRVLKAAQAATHAANVAASRCKLCQTPREETVAENDDNFST